MLSTFLKCCIVEVMQIKLAVVVDCPTDRPTGRLTDQLNDQLTDRLTGWLINIWKVESGKCEVESGKWKVESGKWKVESEKWKVESGKESGPFTAGLKPPLHCTNNIE